MTMQAQAHICPWCFDDHSTRDCETEDLREVIAELRKDRARLDLWKQRALRLDAALRKIVNEEHSSTIPTHIVDLAQTAINE